MSVSARLETEIESMSVHSRLGRLFGSVGEVVFVVLSASSCVRKSSSDGRESVLASRAR